MKNSQITLALYLSCVLVGVSGCGGSGQDVPEQKALTKDVSFSGLAIDGHIARAMVFLDTNNNATRDPWEAFAFTDNDGYYSYNPKTKIDYCATTATIEQAQYCLRSAQAMTSVVVRTDGGYDVLTGEPFVGQLSRRVDVSGEQTVFSVISPITTLLVSAANESEANTILTSLDLQKSDLDIDYVNSTEIVNTKILKTAVTVQKVASVLADRLTDTYTKIGDDFGTPNDASAIVYNEIAKHLVVNKSSFSDVTNTSTLANILDKSEEKLRAIYANNDYPLPQDMGSAAQLGKFERIIGTASQIPVLVNTLIPITPNAQMQSDVAGNVKAIESVVIKTLNERGTDTSIDSAIKFFTNTNNQTLVNTLTTGLSDTTSDLNALIKSDFTAAVTSPESIAQLVKIPETIQPFGAIAGFKIKVSDMNLGFAPNNLKDEEVEFYFQGGSNAANGSFLACVKYINDASSDGTLGDGNTRGELVKGYWSLLGATETNLASYNLLLTIEFLGAKYSATIKPAESVVVAGETIKQYRFDNNGEFIVWRSPQGLRPIDSLPTSSRECEQRLPSRLGFTN